MALFSRRMMSTPRLDLNIIQEAPESVISVS